MTGVLRPDANAGKVALVTGGGTGIGRGVALALAASGAKVAICGRRLELLEGVRAELEAEGCDCLALSADVREPDQVERLVTSVRGRLRSTCSSTTPGVSSARRLRRSAARAGGRSTASTWMGTGI